MSLFKRLSVFALVITTVMWSFGGLTVKAAGSYGAGSLLAKAGVKDAAVYYIGSDGKKYVFPDVKTYNTWYSNFNSVVKVAVTELDLYPDGGAVTYRPGTKLVTNENSAKVYAVEPGGVLRWISTAAIASSLYGANWGTKVQNVIPGYFSSSYTVGADLGSTFPTGTLITSGSTTYYISGTTKRPFSSADAFEANNFKWADVLTVADLSAYTAGSSITGEIEALSGYMPGETTSVAAGNLSVALASDTPAYSFAYRNSTHVPFTKIKLTAGADAVTIDSMVIERTGAPASDGAFTGVNIMKTDNSLVSSGYKTLNASHQATFTEDVVVPANTSIYLMLVGKMANSTSYAGEMPTLSLASLSTSATVTGSLPITGNPKQLNASVSVGTLTVSESPAPGVLTEEIGTKDVEFLNVKLANDSSAANIRIDSMRFNNVGSADGSDLENVELVVDGNVIATSSLVDNYATFNLASCGTVCLIPYGKNETFTLRGDIIGGSLRTFDFDIKKADDIMGYDTLNGAYVTPSAGTTSSRVVTISRGTLNVTKTNVVPASNVAEDTADLSLGSWNFKVAGEPITISTILFDVDVTGTVSSTDFTKLKLVDSTGRSLTGATDATEDSTALKDGYISFTDSFTLPEGNNAITLVGTLSADAANADTVQFGVDFLTVSSSNLDATGDVSGDSITIATYAFPQSVVSANLITITDLSLAVTSLSNPAAQIIAAGTTGHTYSTIRFDATGSSENVKVTAFEFGITASATAKTNELQNITFVVNGTPLSITKSGTKAVNDTDEEISVSLSGTDQFVIPKGTAVNMVIKADLSAGATAGGSHRIDITSANNPTDGNVVTAQGATSGNDINAAEGTARANYMTVGAAGGTIEVSLDSTNPNSSLFASGATVDLAKFNFYATTTENVELDYLYLTQVVTDTNSSSYKDYDEIWFVNEAGVEVTGTRMSPTSTKPKIEFGDNAFVVPYTDTNGVVLTLKAQLATIGSGYNGVSDHYVGYMIAADADVVAKGDLTGNATKEYLSTSAAPTGNTNYMYKGYPVIARVPMTHNLGNGTIDLFKFTVTAVNNDISFWGLTFDIVTTTCQVTNLYVIDVTSTEKILNGTAGTANLKVWQTVGTDWTTNYAGREVTVSGGTTRTFVLRGDVTEAAAGDSIQTRLVGDAAHVAGTTTLLHSAAGVDADANGDFVWSDKSAGAHTYATVDWTNGYLVSGLTSPSSSAQVVAL
jgi:hypothetical protein